MAAIEVVEESGVAVTWSRNVLLMEDNTVSAIHAAVRAFEVLLQT
jgi:hypothetical protein